LSLTGEGHGILYHNTGTGEVPYNPFNIVKADSENSGASFTIELIYKTKNIGNFNASVLSC
jgi:hypothetical protein